MASVNTPPASKISLVEDWSALAGPWLSPSQAQPASVPARPKKATSLRMKHIPTLPTPERPAFERAAATQAARRAFRAKMTQRRGFVWSIRR